MQGQTFQKNKCPQLFYCTKVQYTATMLGTKMTLDALLLNNLLFVSVTLKFDCDTCFLLILLFFLFHVSTIFWLSPEVSHLFLLQYHQTTQSYATPGRRRKKSSAQNTRPTRASKLAKTSTHLTRARHSKKLPPTSQPRKSHSPNLS